MRARERLVSHARAMRAAVAFLTLLPVDPRGSVDSAALARGAVYFPLVGAFVGAATAAVAWGLAFVFPATVAALGAVTASALLTGALHLDGLADTVDGYGAPDAERALAIMRDHAVGSYGLVAVFLDLALRTAAIAVLVTRPGGLLVLVAAGALSRAAGAALGAVAPYARAEAGLGSVLSGSGRLRAAWVAVLGTAIAAVAAWPAGLAAAVLVGVLVNLWGWHCRRRLGGVTGDTLGAASEGSEVVVLLVGVALR